MARKDQGRYGDRYGDRFDDRYGDRVGDRGSGDDWSRHARRSEWGAGYGGGYGRAGDYGHEGGGVGGYGRDSGLPADVTDYGGSWARAFSYPRGPHEGKGPRGYVRRDERIMEDVCEALMRDHDVDASDIEVRVEGGEVTLTGRVESRAARRRAEELVERCAGVRDVRNELRTEGGRR